MFFFLNSLVLFSSLAFAGQERPIFEVSRLTAAGVVKAQYYADEIIVKPRPDAIVSAVTKAHELRAALSSESCDTTGMCYLPYQGDARAMSAVVSALSQDRSFEWASLSPVFKAQQVSAPLTNDPAIQGQWNLGSALPGGIGWKSFSGPVPEKVYVVGFDSGGCFTHEDFDWSRNETKLNYHAEVADKEPNTVPYDDNGHGCSTMSIVAAKSNNGRGIAGIADFVRTGYFKVLNNRGLGNTKTIVSAILELAVRVRDLPPGSRVIALLGFGTSEFVPPLEEAIQIARRAGIIFVAPAGNEGSDLSRFPRTPATTEGVFSVAACDTTGALVRKSYWASNYGGPTLVCAPGVETWVAVPKPMESFFYEFSDPQGYQRAEGTSISAPHVAGVIAHLLAENLEISEEEIRIRLLNGRRDIPGTNIWSRQYSPRDLYVAGATLFMPTALSKTSTAPARPVLEVAAGHSSARVQINQQPFGIRCFYGNIGDQRTWEAIPFFGNGEFILRNKDGSPLGEKEAFQLACRAVDGAGRWSEISPVVTFTTRESVSEVLPSSTFVPTRGPLADFIEEKNPNSPQLWGFKTFPLLAEPVWYAGTDSFSYRVGDNDSVLESGEIMLPHDTAVSVTVKQFVQMIGTALQGSHYDLSELSVVWTENGEQKEKVVRQIMPNARQFGLETVSFDVSELAGKTVRLRFRLFTNGSSVGAGWIVGGVTVKTDR
ncbi:MAG: S8/S53 family peptidase [Candidatus Doudnabacteria bacterium]|nr:S8/S53 family peptidase [Candidatus Doudnabacteria bacterium]